MTYDQDGAAPTIQYAHKGRWHNLHGHGVASDGLHAYVERRNAIEEYRRYRVARTDQDEEDGAPEEPVYAYVPMDAETMREFNALCGRDLEQGLDETGRTRMKEILRSTRGERIEREDPGMAGARAALITRIRDMQETDR